MENEFTSSDLMNYFNISKGSWFSIKNKLRLDNYGTKEIVGKRTRFIYSEQAFDILNDYYSFKGGSVEDNKNLTLIKVQSKEIEELKNISATFQRYYDEEREKNEKLLLSNTDLLSKLNQLELENQRIKNLSLFRRIFKLY